MDKKIKRFDENNSNDLERIESKIIQSLNEAGSKLDADDFARKYLKDSV